ncbi:MAG TPA: Spy/CpxP family protein refolding chaperone [Blastocatellia bacterium]|nr:Spy/CpxP family protein refolding chaperone [Blastocatellia bacterium]
MRISFMTVTLLSAVCMVVLCANTVSAQNRRRQMRIQRQIDKRLNRPDGNQNRPSPPNTRSEEQVPVNQLEATGTRVTPRQGGQSLEGIKERGIRSFIKEEERSLIIQGFSNPIPLLVILRQLDLTPEQKAKIRDVRRQVGDRLQQTRREMNQLEGQLDEAIYGNLDPASLDSYDPAKVKELTEQVIQKRGEWYRLQTDIESQFRQILTPDQFYVFRELAREMVRPGARPLVNPAARQQQQQRRLGIQPNQQTRPDQQNRRDND